MKSLSSNFIRQFLKVSSVEVPEKEVWLSDIEARITHLGIVGHLSKYGLGGYVSISPYMYNTS
jgi:hypothetical protein